MRQYDIEQARAQRKAKRRERKEKARGANSPNVYVEQSAPLWLSSGSLAGITTPLYPTQVPIRPRVLYTDRAWFKLQHLIRTNTLEVGWWGTVTKTGNTYTIDDIFVPKQSVSAATTDITAEGLAEVAMKLVEQQGHADNLLYWGHLHPSFSVQPSGRDERTCQEYLETFGPDSYFIRGIYNKQGESKVDVYVKETANSGWAFQSVENTRVPIVLDEVEYRQFTAEISLNVAQKVFPQTKNHGGVVMGRSHGGKFTKIMPVPDMKGLYRVREGTGSVGGDGILAQLDDSEMDDMVSYDDLTDPHLVRGEGYAK